VCLLLKQALFYSIFLSNDSHPLPPLGCASPTTLLSLPSPDCFTPTSK
jgi:hypothetical protein